MLSKQFAIWLSLGWLVILTNFSYGTTVIAIRTPSLIVLGADSKVTRGDNSEIGNTCKIRRTNNIFSSYAGSLLFPP